MFQGLTTVAKTLWSAATAIQEFRKRAETKHQQLALLTAQYCFVGIAKTGRELLDLAGPKPLEKLMSLSADELRTFNALAQRHMALQLTRLQKLNGLLQDKEVVEIFDISLRREIEEAIGDKEQGLYSIGAGLMFYCVYLKVAPDSNKREDLKRTADLIADMYPEIEAGIISIPDAMEALDSLIAAAQRYGEVLKLIIPVDRFVPLSKEAAKLASVDS